MDFNRALKILELNQNFSEEDLKKAYRRIIREYHPDKYENKSEKERNLAEEKTKEINLAKEYLENYLKRSKPKSYQNNRTYKTNEDIELLLKKEQLKIIINNMKTELSSIPNVLFDDMLRETRDKIINKLNLRLTLFDSTYSLSLFKMFENSYYTNIANILEEFEKAYCKKYNITLENQKLERYSLKKLYEQLEQIKKEQNGFSIEELLEKELTKYVYYKGYIVIKKLIQNIQKDIVYKNSITRNTKEEIINEFNLRVLNEFKEYYERLEILNQMKLLKLTRPKLNKSLELMEQYIAVPEMFKYLEKEVINALADTETKIEKANKTTKKYIKKINR